MCVCVVVFVVFSLTGNSGFIRPFAEGPGEKKKTKKKKQLSPVVIGVLKNQGGKEHILSNWKDPKAMQTMVIR